MALTGQQFTIAAGDQQATIVEVGAGLRRYVAQGADVTCSYAEDVLPPKCCGGVLVPWPNRLRGGRYAFEGTVRQLPVTEPATGNAIHGLGRWARWSAVSHDASSVTLRQDLVPQTGWPFEVCVELTYSLGTDGLTVTATATNQGSGRAPFGAGFHPYLSTRGAALADTRVTVPARTRLLSDAQQIPVGSESVAGTGYDLRAGRPLGESRMDDGFTDLIRDASGRVRAAVHTPAGGAMVWCDSAFGYLQVFTLDEFPDAGTPGVAIEPMTCAPDAFNSGAGLVVLEAGSSWRGSWGISPQ